MAVVKPFQALRFDFSKAGPPQTVCCPPYDIIHDAAEWTENSPFNAIFLEGGERLTSKDPYGDAKKYTDNWLSSGFLYEDAKPAFYIYEAAFTAKDGSEQTLRGVAALLELSPFSKGVVLPHEFTLSAAKEDRRKLMMETQCQYSPIYALYDDPEGTIAALIKPALSGTPDCVFTMPDNVRHSLRTLSDHRVCDDLVKAFSDKKIFIADGHHRYETLLSLREETGKPQYAMVFLAGMNDSGVDVQATHRVVTGMNWYGEEALRNAMEAHYIVSEGDEPVDGTFVWITGSGRYMLKPKHPWTVKSSVAALHQGILEPMLGINADTMAKGKNLIFTRSADEAAHLVRSGDAQCAFLLPEPKISELRDTVLAGEKMPQKSTYFFPKIVTGLFMWRF